MNESYNDKLTWVLQKKKKTHLKYGIKLDLNSQN